MASIIGISGDKGSFSEEAALLYAKQNNIDYKLHYLIDMEGVLKAITQDTIELGLFPVVNLQGGLVTSAFEAMGKYVFQPVDELWLHVKQCLLVLPGTQQINDIVSHPQGLAQCKHYLQKEFKHASLRNWCDTAHAAKTLANGELTPHTAVIASELSAKLYGLEVLASNIQDDKSNATAFIVVTNRGD